MNPGNNLPIITLGFRLQRSRIQVKDSRIDDTNKWYDDTIIGGFVSVMFMF
ncbi:MAG: hypothetical protein N3F66_14245 [Spirochaetes bacterium]|nr:hypothetical protein [Spirochaetota bacterium]